MTSEAVLLIVRLAKLRNCATQIHMKNVTIAIDDEIHRRARVRAAEMGTSLSALVKEYLTQLVEDGYPVSPPVPSGVRDVQMPFNHDIPAAWPASPAPAAPAAKGPEGQPYFVNGKWTFTPDGKPRKPGALRGKLRIADDFDEWPADILASFEAWPYDDPDYKPEPWGED
jgi:plasmid stability protein